MIPMSDTGLPTHNAGWAEGDFDGDGVVAFADFLLLSTNFGTSRQVQAVPETNASPLLLLLLCRAVRTGQTRHAQYVNEDSRVYV